MTQTKNLRNDEVFRRFLTGDDEPLRNHTGSLTTRIARDGTVLLEGYGHNLYAERRPSGQVIVYEGNIEWAWNQYPAKKPGMPQTVRHMRNLMDEADELGVDYTTEERALRTAGVPRAPGDLSAIGRIGGWD